MLAFCWAYCEKVKNIYFEKQLRASAFASSWNPVFIFQKSLEKKYWKTHFFTVTVKSCGINCQFNLMALTVTYIFFLFHETIIRTGITCKKILSCIPNSGCKWFIIKKAEIFWSYVKHFWILASVRKCRMLIGLWKEDFCKFPTIFLDWNNKMKLAPASFSCFSDF